MLELRSRFGNAAQDNPLRAAESASPAKPFGLQRRERFAGSFEVRDSKMKDALAVLPKMEVSPCFGHIGYESGASTVASQAAASLRPAPQESRANSRSGFPRSHVPPNRALNRTRRGMAPWPHAAQAYHASCGQGTMPRRAG